MKVNLKYAQQHIKSHLDTATTPYSIFVAFGVPYSTADLYRHAQ